MWKRRVEVRLSESSLCERPGPGVEETAEAWEDHALEEGLRDEEV